MKKWIGVLFLTFLAAVLVACGENADPNETNGNEEANANEENEEETGDLSAEDVYKKAMEASAEMESAEVEMDMDQTMDSGDGESMKTSTSSTMELVMDPVAFYQEATTSMDMDGEKMDSETKMYFVDDEMYMHESEMDEWIKMDSGMMGDLSEMVDQQDPEEQLKIFEDVMSDFEMEETGDTYILEMEADGDEFTELVQEFAEENMPPEMLEQMEAEGVDMFEQMEINNVDYEMTLDKESFDIDNLKMDMDMDMEVEGENLNTQQNIDMDYISINEVDAIEIPEDVKDEAMDEEEFQE
ncbi:MAG TPA: DUF6612 family protein, partial [Pseudogracilibacillus sp.]|nr:DUF6612 family protein [Pseudogracilibacillus sp.]